MKYGLVTYVNVGSAGPLYIVEIDYDTLADALAYYSKYDGIEFYNYEEIYNNDLFVCYVVAINIVDDNGNIVKLLMGKYRALDLQSLYSDFWEIYYELDKSK